MSGTNPIGLGVNLGPLNEKSQRNAVIRSAAARGALRGTAPNASVNAATARQRADNLAREVAANSAAAAAAAAAAASAAPAPLSRPFTPTNQPIVPTNKGSSGQQSTLSQSNVSANSRSGNSGTSSGTGISRAVTPSFGRISTSPVGSESSSSAPPPAPASPARSVGPSAPSIIEKLVNTNTPKKNPALVNLPALIALSRWNPIDAAKAARTILTAVGDTLPAEVRAEYEKLSQPLVENAFVAAAPLVSTINTARARAGLQPLTAANAAVSGANELAAMRRYKELGIKTNAIPDAERHAIAELIAYEPDENGFATLKFLVEVDTDEAMEGGARETYQQYISRLQNKDYVEKTYDLAMSALGYYGLKRRQFETTRVGDQCRGVGIDDRKPCWLCGNPVNLFKGVRGPMSYTMNGAEFRMCEPDNNSFQCEHILPAGLMAFLDYLYINEGYPDNPANRAIMNQLYESSCKTCNRIKTNNLYIRSTLGGLFAMFEPNAYEIQKDVIAFFLDICGSKKRTCLGNNQSDAIKKEGEAFYYNSVVTVTKEDRTTHYPNLILAKLNEEERTRGVEPENKKRRRGSNNAYTDAAYGSLGHIFRSLENTFTIARIYDSTNEFDVIPETIEKRIPLRRGVDWIQNCSRRILARVQGVCDLLNDVARKTEWNAKYQNALLNPPRFVEDIVRVVPRRRMTARRVGVRQATHARRAVNDAEERRQALIRRNESARLRAIRAAARADPPPLQPTGGPFGFNDEMEGQHENNNSVGGGRQRKTRRNQRNKTRKAPKKNTRRK